MASLAFTDGRFELNSVVLSTFTTSVKLEISAEALDDTAMGDTYHSRIGGLKDWSAEVEMNQDFAASAPDVSLFSILGTVVTAKFRATSAAISTTNPEYSGSVLVESVTPFGNGVGDLAKVTVKLSGAGTLARATT